MKNQRGMTIIELLLTMGIFFVISSSSYVFYSSLIIQNMTQTATQQLVSQLRRAQNNALNGKEGSNWGVHYAGRVLTLYRGNTYASRVVSYDEQFTVSPSVAVNGFNEVNFTRRTGTPSATANVSVSGGGTVKVVKVLSNGTATE